MHVPGGKSFVRCFAAISDFLHLLFLTSYPSSSILGVILLRLSYTNYLVVEKSSVFGFGNNEVQNGSDH